MTTTTHRPTTHLALLALLGLSLVWLGGCPSRDLKPLTPCVVSGVVANIQQNPADKIDVLFVVDNSFSMDAEQTALSAEFQEMVRILVTGDTDNDGDQDNPPVNDLHLGVVTTDLGNGGLAVQTPLGTCGTENRTEGVEPAVGDDGVLQTKGDTSDAACEDTYPAFLAYACDDEECSTPAKETERDQLAQDFACVAKLGIGGCGLEQPLEAALKALSDPAAAEPVTFTSGQGRGGADDPFNAGFIRPDSLLAIVLVTDEEDCSSPDPRMFEDPATFTGQDPPPVAAVPFRCADKEWGDADKLYPVERYVDGFLKLREGREQLLVFAAITGVPQSLVDANKSDQGNYNFDAILGDNQDTNHPLTQEQTPVCIFNPQQNVATDTDAVRPSCGEWKTDCADDNFSQNDQFAFPPRRIVDVARGLSEPTGGNAVVQSICPPEGSSEPDFAPALNEILNKIGDALAASTCLPRELKRNSSGEVNCSVIETLPVGVTCDSQAGRSLRDTKDGLEVCVVAQLPTSNEQSDIPVGDGWYYDDFTTTVDGAESPRLKYCGEEGRRVAFTGAPAAGSSVRLECTQPVKSASTNEPGSVGSSCSADADCAVGDCAPTETDSAPCACEPNNSTCQYDCVSDVDCSQKASSAYVCNPESGFCVTPTCQ